MFDIRRLHKEEYAKAAALADRTFRDDTQISMATAFPALFSAHLGQGFGAFEHGELVTFLGIMPYWIHVDSARIPVYALGSVCTDSRYRGRKLASQVLEAVLDHARAAGAPLLLISGDGPLYRRIHCAPFGVAYAHRLTAPNHLRRDGGHAAGRADWQIREFKPTDWFRVHALANARAVRYEQSLVDLATAIASNPLASCAHSVHHALVAEQDGEVRAFAVLAVPYREDDEAPTVVTEWAGDAAACAAIFHHILCKGTQQRPLQLFLSESENDALAPFLETIQAERQRNQGTVCILSAEKLFADLKPYCQARDAELAATLSAKPADANRTTLTIGEHTLTVTPEELIAFVFDTGTPPNEHAPISHWSSEIEILRQRLFPIPFPFTGGLNFI
ncbi:MAG: GNAT family N-acetyltransferase [Alicyclobacillaceae bacterium]|nr:GNAT family N-acetyltransferase [Alicyclobacillaceae bacterium]